MPDVGGLRRRRRLLFARRLRLASEASSRCCERPDDESSRLVPPRLRLRRCWSPPRCELCACTEPPWRCDDGGHSPVLVSSRDVLILGPSVVCAAVRSNPGDLRPIPSPQGRVDPAVLRVDACSRGCVNRPPRGSGVDRVRLGGMRLGIADSAADPAPGRFSCGRRHSCTSRHPNATCKRNTRTSHSHTSSRRQSVPNTNLTLVAGPTTDT